MNRNLIRNYLVPHGNPIAIPITCGEWDRTFHEKIFIKTNDWAFERYCSISDKKLRPEIAAQAFKLIAGGSYGDIIPDISEYFFETANQALQIIHDNLCLRNEVLKKNARLYLPCIGFEDRKYVIEIFNFFGLLMAPYSFRENNKTIEMKQNSIFILPELD